MSDIDKLDVEQTITLPTGETITSSEIGVDFIVAQSGQVPTHEIVDSVKVSKTYVERRNYVENEPLLKAVTSRSPASEIIDRVFLDIAEELAHLKFERQVAAREGKNTAAYTLQRRASLK